jgi:glycosyltransferase involved in cell wall biosynthesis
MAIVSIITPFRNASAFLKETIDSVVEAVQSSSGVNVEWVLFDDASEVRHTQAYNYISFCQSLHMFVCS